MLHLPEKQGVFNGFQEPNIRKERPVLRISNAQKKMPKMPEQEIMKMPHKKWQTFPKTHDWQPLMYK